MQLSITLKSKTLEYFLFETQALKLFYYPKVIKNIYISPIYP